MKFWYAIAGIIAFIIMLPYIRCFFKRLSCMRKIHKLCQRKGYCLYPTHKLWFFGNKHSLKCDLHIETPNELFAIKLFGVPRRTSVLVIKENGEYFIRRFIAFIAYGSKHKPLPSYNFRHNYKDEWEIKTPRHILLVNPVSMEFRRSPQHGTEIIIGAGDIVNGMEIDSLPRLLGDLENAL